MCKISVIVPLYNAEYSIRNTLNSIQHQSFDDIEIICVDDGSTDQSSKIIKCMQKSDDRIHYFYQINRGAGVARNLGIDKAKGEYIAFMDSDDNYPDNYALESLYNAAKKTNALICGGSAVIKDDIVSDDGKRTFNLEGLISFQDYQYDYLFYRFIYLRKFIIQNKIFFPSYRVYEDPIFLIKAMTKAKVFTAIKKGVYMYTGSHQSKNMTLLKTEDLLKAIIEELNISSEYKLSKLHKIVYERLETEASFYASKYIYDGNKEIFSLILQANNVIDRKLIGLDDNYNLTAIVDLWRAGQKYIKIKESKIIKFILSLKK